MKISLFTSLLVGRVLLNLELVLRSASWFLKKRTSSLSSSFLARFEVWLEALPVLVW